MVAASGVLSKNNKSPPPHSGWRLNDKICPSSPYKTKCLGG